MAETPKHPHEAPVLLWLGPGLLAVLGLAAALFSGFTHFYVSSPMASAVQGDAVRVTISPVPHLGLPLALSILTVMLGVATYWQIERARGFMVSVLDAAGPGPDRGFDSFVAGLVRFGWRVTRIVQPGRLEIYVTCTFLCVAAILLVAPVLYGEFPSLPAWPRDVQLHEWAVFLLAVIGLAAVLVARDLLTAIVSLGIQGFSVALIFLLFGAPDLAFTQFLVETLSVVILALVMTRLRLAPTDPRPAAPAACGYFDRTRLRAWIFAPADEGDGGAVQHRALGLLQHLFENHRPWRQCRERHHRRLPRHRHAGRDRRRRDHRPCHSRADRTACGV